MKSRKAFAALLLSFFVVLPACNQANRKNDQATRPLVTVNGVEITADDIVLWAGGHEDIMNSPLRDKAIDDVVNAELLYQKGLKLGLDKDKKYQSQLQLLEKKIATFKRVEMARRVKNVEIASRVNVTDQDLKDYYNQHTKEIDTDLRLGVLQFPDEAQAKDALARMRAGTPFEKVADGQFPHSPKKGGKPAWDKGFLHWNQMPPDWASSLYGLKKGEVSDVLAAAQSGICIIKVINRKKNKDAGYAGMKPAITNRLNEIKIREAYDRYVEQLKRESSIKRYDGRKS